MRKSLLLLAMGLLCLTARAIPADPTPVQVQQPDGSTLTIKLHGDEFFHYTTTIDGYTVVQNDKGYYTYARRDGERLVTSGVVAHDPAHRTAAEHQIINTLSRRLISPAMAREGAQKLRSRNSAMRRLDADEMMDYGNFKGLIILVNYTDKKFSMGDPSSFYDDMVNTPDYTGYTLNGRRVDMTGSVRDYFYDNSNHIFDPRFDVVGPITINYSCRYPQETTYSRQICEAALKAADPLVDYKDYDSDGDGYVDMVFFLVAGYSSNYGGNNRGYLWPHMYYLYWSPPLDGAYFGLYACSTEIAGWEAYMNDHDINGIGTICHEFGHVLGLPDLYDTDYEQGGGGQSRDPGRWSVMANGSSNDYGRSPVGYSLYERYALGFTQPVVIDDNTHISLEPLDVSNLGYRLNTINNHEFFLIENRQEGKWDHALPGHGMLVARVDSTNARVWEYNEVNSRPDHMYYELLRADYQGFDSDSDPFPGHSGVTAITNFTNPSLLTWDGALHDFNINNIAEQGWLLTFDIERDTSIVTDIEDFEAMPVTTNTNATGVRGTFCDWNFLKCAVNSPEEGQCNGLNAVAMKKPCQMTSVAPLQVKADMVRFSVFNPTTVDAKVRINYSADEGSTWMTPTNGILTIAAGETSSISVRIPTDAPVMLRFNQIAGSDKKECYLDDIKVYYQDTWPVHNVADVNLDGEVNVADVNSLIDMIMNDSPTTTGDVNGDGEINISDVNFLIEIILNSRS